MALSGDQVVLDLALSVKLDGQGLASGIGAPSGGASGAWLAHAHGVLGHLDLGKGSSISEIVCDPWDPSPALPVGRGGPGGQDQASVPRFLGLRFSRSCFQLLFLLIAVPGGLGGGRENAGK